MKQLVLRFVLFGLFSSAAWAGVVIEMEVTDSKSPDKAANETFYAQGEMARMDPHPADSAADMMVIFRDQAMWFVDHNKKVCQKIDKEGMAELSTQLNAIMKQMENLPPEQRAMMEEMMKGKMPGMAEAPPRRVETGAVEKVGDYFCTLHTLYSGEAKVWEVCTAGENMGEDIVEAMGAFRALSSFTGELQEILQQGPFASMIQTPYNELDELDGFPVRVRTFDNKGKVVRESKLKSITSGELAESTFAIPAGYEIKDLKDEMNKGR
jgi:hypothetical protein